MGEKGGGNAATARAAALQMELEEARRQMDGIGHLRAGLIALLGDSAGAGASVATVDEDALVSRVLARLPTGGAPVVQVAPPEALRKKYLEKATIRILVARLAPLSADAREAIEYLLAHGTFFAVTAVAKALSGNTHGGTRERWGKALKELLDASLAAKGGSGRSEYRANVRGCVEAELGPHGATEGEIAAVEQQVLYRLSRMGEGATS